MKGLEAANKWPGVGMVKGPGGLSTCWAWGSGGLAPGGLRAAGGRALGQLQGAWWHSARPLLRAPSICCSAGTVRTGGENRTEAHSLSPYRPPAPELRSPSPGPALRTPSAQRGPRFLAVPTGCSHWVTLLAATNY